MKSEFQIVERSCLDSLPEQALEHLNEASKAMDGYFPLARAMEQAKSGAGEIYLVFHKQKLHGAMFLNFRMLSDKRVVMNLPLLGGSEMWLWAKDLGEFLHNKARQIGADEFTILGREGWGKLFPELEKIGSIFRRKLTVVK